MLANTRNTKHAGLKSAIYGMAVTFGLISTALVVFAADGGERDSKNAATASIVPTARTSPQYPVEALKQNLVGWVQLQFTIDETGSVRDAYVVDNCVWQQNADASTCTPNSMFDAVTLAAIAGWNYEPNIEKGVAVKREGVQTIIKYELEEESEESAETTQ